MERAGAGDFVLVVTGIRIERHTGERPGESNS